MTKTEVTMRLSHT